MTKLSSLEANKDAEHRVAKMHDEDIERKRTESLRHTEVLMARLADADDRAAAADAEMRRAIGALNDVEARHAAVLALQDDAVRFALQCIDDVRQQQRHANRSPPKSGTPPTGAAHPAPEAAGERSLATISADDREEVLTYLLDQLRSYQQQLQELALHSAWEQHANRSLAQPPSMQPPLALPPIAGAKPSGSNGRSFGGQMQPGEQTIPMGLGGSGKTYGVRGTIAR